MVPHPVNDNFAYFATSLKGLPDPGAPSYMEQHGALLSVIVGAIGFFCVNLFEKVWIVTNLTKHTCNESIRANYIKIQSSPFKRISFV